MGGRNKAPADFAWRSKRIIKCLDLDANGNLVNMTIEHASRQANIAEVAYQQMKSKSA